MAQRVTDLPEWRALKAHQAKMRGMSLQELFTADPDRRERLTFRAGALEVDLSHNHLTDVTVALLADLAGTRGLEDRRDRMFRGEKINTSENRAVLHTALRAKGGASIAVDGHDIMPDIRSVQERMAAFVADVRKGLWKGATGQVVHDVVNIGIGGSDLGPRLVVSALRLLAKSGPRVHFVANADAADLSGVLEGLDPATTLFLVVSKTFSTQETLLNASTARRWLVDKLGETAVARHFVAVSTNVEAVGAFGIAPANVFPMWEWVGGRYSVWSAVGLGVALAIGWSHFRELLDGAAEMDEHFQTAPLNDNVPALLGLTGIWYRNFWETACHAVLPYSERLRDLPRYLQQLEMESNGKSVTREGESLDYGTAPALIGECGTIGQHSFHQWLHQGTDITPSDFIGIRHDDLGHPEHHRALLANLEGQVRALTEGRHDPDPQRSNPGNRPATVIWLERHDPRSLGNLLALYEHKVFTQGVVWGINSFDQWGVELGKTLAKEALKNA